jgi:hypothetical protein
MSAAADRDAMLAEMVLWHSLYRLEVQHWHDVNVNAGRAAHTFYVEHGVFVVGESRHEGREKIRQFYDWRARRGARTARHLVTNFQVKAGPDGRTASGTGVISLYAADGAPILLSKPATMIADLRAECELCDDGLWRYVSHMLHPLFRGEGRLAGEGAAQG